VVQRSFKKAGAEVKQHRSLRAKDAKEFLAKYKEAWEARNADLAASLFTRDARYRRGPFGETVVSREAIHDHWKASTKRQENIHFVVNNFFHVGYILVAEWTCTYRDRSSRKTKELAGMFLADFYGTQVRAFRQYWLSRTL
jgi:nuclear transport factor 2 (NTF2) superfamily protein